MDVLADEVKESYAADKTITLQSNEVSDMQGNIEAIVERIEMLVKKE